MSHPQGVSVVIPTFNRAAFLADSIASVLNQQGEFNIDLIVVDDGSTDNTQDVIATFGSKLRYRKIPPSGRPAVPRNVGIRMAKHNLIAFQDSDDRWAPDKLATQIQAFKDEAVALSYGNASMMDANGTPQTTKMIDPGLTKSGDIFSDLVAVNFISTLTVMVRKTVLEEVGFFNESPKLRAVEDYQLWLRIASRHRIQYVDDILAYYRAHSGNISGASNLNAHLLLTQVYRHLGPLSAAQTALVRDRRAGIYAELYRLSSGNPKYLLLSIYHRATRKLLTARKTR
jgi:glycosyltransferase involved in cell wall biosynthesis